MEQQKIENVEDQAMRDEGQTIKTVTINEMIDGQPEHPSDFYQSPNTQYPGI